MTIQIVGIALCLAMLSGTATAQATHHGGAHGSPNQGGSASAAASPATQGYREANARMHRDMDIRFGNDADVDFVRSMIPHHEGAIAMARVALEHATDDQVRRWAAEVIREQEREIGEMRTWLRLKGVP